MKPIIKTSAEIEFMREGGKILAAVLKIVEKNTKSGVTTLELNNIAEAEILKRRGMPSFKDYNPNDNDDDNNKYPAALCVSINDKIVHGIPDGTKIKDGDIVGLDLGVEYKGCYTDAALTVIAGNCSEEARRLVETTKQCLDAAIAKVKDGARLGDIGAAVQKTAESAGFSVVRDLSGHGVGRYVHEDPMIPNFGKPNRGLILREGMTLAIEPMINAGRPEVYVMDDEWAYATKDGKSSAHFEHTILVTKEGCEILTKEL